jgi:membrane protein DedA with SNARE-associated domain
MRKRRVLFLSLIIILMLSLFFLLLYYGPQEIINEIGVGNSYIILFLFAIFGGVSALTATSFFATLGAFYFGGLNLFVLVFIGGIGLTIGDSFFYYVGRKSHELSRHTSYKNRVVKLKNKLEGMSPRLAFLFIFLYAAITPLPKDILCFVLGFGEHPYIKSMTPMFIGNMVFLLIFLFLVSFGIELRIF